MKKGDSVIILNKDKIGNDQIKSHTEYVIDEIRDGVVFMLSGIKCCLLVERFTLVDNLLNDNVKVDKVNSVDLSKDKTDLSKPMNLTITLPNSDLSVVEWFIKHKVATSVKSLDFSVDISFKESE